MQMDKMQKNDKMQIGQNAKVLNINNPKYSILGVPIENQCVKGGGLLYGGFGLPIFGIFCILSGLHFVCFDVLSHLHFVKFAFCHGFVSITEKNIGPPIIHNLVQTFGCTTKKGSYCALKHQT